ncbi:hypothetical protein U9M48_026221 [Paspalum notatum var. saurae]|uniref:Uncharacterized protein n=1 Tax=Paspalum notatum var. saurae TaxID=547442 RepID=A0AAQ3TS13_PASNO
MAAAASSTSSDWDDVLLDGYALIGDERNHTTDVDFTRNDERIVASFWSSSPACTAFSEPPRILRMVEGLILFRVAIRCRELRCRRTYSYRQLP